MDDASTIEVVPGRLVAQPVAALMLSANNHLAAGSGWSKSVETMAGSAYIQECRDLASVGPAGIPLGSAVVTGGGKLATDGARKWILQAITTGYVHTSGTADQRRIPATPGVLYVAVRAALERAEMLHIGSVATYLMCQRDGYATRSAPEMADTFCRALLDHAAIAVWVRRIVICQDKQADVAIAAQTLARAKVVRVQG